MCTLLKDIFIKVLLVLKRENTVATLLQTKTIISVLHDLVVLSKTASAKPPKKWWDKMYKEVKEKNPEYSDEQISATIGKIWYGNLSRKKKKTVRQREGKKLK